MSLDERLRQSLRGSSGAVDPDPEENLHVVRRKTRRLVIRHRIAQATLAAAAVVGLVLAAPRVLDFVRSVHPVQPASPAPTAFPTSSSTHPDPLEGDWRQVATCQDIVRTMTRIGAAPWIPQQLQRQEGAAKPPPKNDPCKGAPATFVRIARFHDGHLLLFDPPLHERGLNALYTVVGDHTFTLVSAPGDHNLSGVFRFTYRIVGDRLRIDLLQDDRDVSTAFEVAPFVRVG
jgi:hypothetical protein